LYEAQNQPEQARTRYEAAARGDPSGSFGAEASMRLEEMQIKYPKLFAPMPAPVAPVPQAVISPAGTNAAPSNASPATPGPAKPEKR
jgi:hypothetical protein